MIYKHLLQGSGHLIRPDGFHFQRFIVKRHKMKKGPNNPKSCLLFLCKSKLSSHLGTPNYSVQSKNDLGSSYTKYTYKTTTVKTPALVQHVINVPRPSLATHNRACWANAISKTLNLSLCCIGIPVILTSCWCNCRKMQHTKLQLPKCPAFKFRKPIYT